ncbi:RNA-directed DNA polymerase [Rathayibacter festucae]|uniref:reverse transcriptase domain-containing protein n=1 Tax=Rathayibacter festucae TaxID=110937 RepID=UPI001FB3B32A|nr:reverse transcriptase domain-containing protein [Rathayibacter festucae]MCJ1702119.1 RNA-directed DNA polymerase [Rathayibacter festucae]
MVTKKELHDSWQHVKDGGSAGRDGETPELFASHLDASIKKINRNLRANTYRFMPYAELLKSKGSGRAPRVISVPSVTDRVALRAMAAFLRGVHAEQTSTRLPQDLVAALIRQLEARRWRYYIKLDIKNFYPTISHEFLEAVLQKTVRDKDIVGTYMSAIRTPTVARGAPRPRLNETRGVPQGLAISNGLAELSLEHLDRFLRSSDKFFALRFVDDILVLTHEDQADGIARRIRELAQLAKLEVHDDTSGEAKSSKGFIDDGFEFLGYKFEWPRVTVRRGSVEKIESRLTRSFTAYKYALKRNPGSEAWVGKCQTRLVWHLNLVITGFTLDQRRVGWLAYFSQIRNQQLLHHLDDIVSAKAKRFAVSDLGFKSFVQTYRIVSSRKEDSTKYVPDFDKYTGEEMRAVLVGVFNYDIAAWPPEKVLEVFYRRIRKLSKELETDVPSYR